MTDSVALKLAAFAVAVLATFGAAFGLGRAIGPLDDEPTVGSTVSTTTTTHPMDHEEMGS